jgi:hypothetical protein
VNSVLASYGLALLADVEEARGRAAAAGRFRPAVRERADLAGDALSFPAPCSVDLPSD